MPLNLFQYSKAVSLSQYVRIRTRLALPPLQPALPLPPTHAGPLIIFISLLSLLSRICAICYHFVPFFPPPDPPEPALPLHNPSMVAARPSASYSTPSSLFRQKTLYHEEWKVIAPLSISMLGIGSHVVFSGHLPHKEEDQDGGDSAISAYVTRQGTIIRIHAFYQGWVYFQLDILGQPLNIGTCLLVVPLCHTKLSKWERAKYWTKYPFLPIEPLEDCIVLLSLDSILGTQYHASSATILSLVQQWLKDNRTHAKDPSPGNQVTNSYGSQRSLGLLNLNIRRARNNDGRWSPPGNAITNGYCSTYTMRQ
ncbi:hypothetical protein BKA70DRAFT_1241002 [Coprinopsis sp. MPI-PUGE-AT-0042]|nr:hypothetical protein BKA70DRAFT_1241002 [Coprinopsis sp. MPI-PUGE-AT-0042]